MEGQDDADGADGCVPFAVVLALTVGCMRAAPRRQAAPLRPTNQWDLSLTLCVRYEGFMNSKFFEEQRREMVAAWAMAEHHGPPDWQDRAGRASPQGNGQGAATRVCAGRGPTVRVPEQVSIRRSRSL